jgi:hypothetical protein
MSENNETLSLSDLGLEEEVTPAQQSAKEAAVIQEGVIRDNRSQNQIEVKKVDMDMSEFQTGPKKSIPRPDNIQTISKTNDQPVQQQTKSGQSDIKVNHSTDPNAGYSTVSINELAKTRHKKAPEDAAKKTLKNLAEQTEAGIARTKAELTAPGGRIDEGKRKYVNDRYATLMGRAQKSQNLMKKIKAYEEIMETDPAFDGADEYEKKAYILFKVAKDNSIGIDDKSFGLAPEALRQVRQSSADNSRTVNKMANRSNSEFDNEDRVVFDENDGIPTVRQQIQEEEKQVEEEVKSEGKVVPIPSVVESDGISIPVKTSAVIPDPVKNDEDDDIFDDDTNTPIVLSDEDNLVHLKPTKEQEVFDEEKKTEEDERNLTPEQRREREEAKELGITIDRYYELKKSYENEARRLLSLTTSPKTDDFTNFSTAGRALTMNEALKIAKRSRPQHLAARWALQYTGIPIRMTALSGEELVQFLSDIETGYQQARHGFLPTIDQLTTIWSTIYNHCEMENKPSFNNWMKRISANDFANFVFAIYLAIFKDTNYLTYRCKKKGCGKLYLEKHDVMEMVKYPNDKIKNRVETILNGGTVDSHMYRTEPIPINDTFAMSFITPSIYSFNFEQSILPLKYRQEHSVTGLMMAIDKVFVIDKARNQFLPIEFGVVADDLEKTVKRKVKALERIFESFSLDQRNIVYHEYQKIVDSVDTDPIKYVLPESTCPVCGNVIPESETNAFEMLFSRARLSIDAASTRA